MRKRLSQARQLSELAAQEGVVNSQTKTKRLLAQMLGNNEHSGTLQKKPNGLPSASHAIRSISYSALTMRSNV